MPKGVYDRTKSKPRRTTEEYKTTVNDASDAFQSGEIPLDAIPGDRPRAARRRRRAARATRGAAHALVPATRGAGAGTAAPPVYAEYDLKADAMMLVLGRLRLPLKVKA